MDTLADAKQTVEEAINTGHDSKKDNTTSNTKNKEVKENYDEENKDTTTDNKEEVVVPVSYTTIDIRL